MKTDKTFAAMRRSNITVGKYLAQLKLDIDHNGRPPFSPNQKSSEAASDMHNEELTKSFAEIPEGTCPISEPYLEKNVDLFLYLYLGKMQSDFCERLTRHLNNCFHCFETFTRVLNDYYREYNAEKKA